MSKIKLSFISLMAIGCSLSLAACRPKGAPDMNKIPNKSEGAPVFPKTYFNQANQQHINDLNHQIKMHMLTKSLKNNYKHLFAVNYVQAKNAITLNPKNKSVKDVIKYAKKHNKVAIKSWRNFAKGVAQTSKSVAKNTNDSTAKLIIVDPKEPHRELYTAANGHTLYNRY